MPFEHLPYFPFYVNDFAADGVVEAMSTEEVGAYILLLCKAWLQNPAGSIPNDDHILARWCRLSEDRWQKSKKSILSAFFLDSDGRYHQKRMQSEYKALINKKKERSKSGSLGAKKRWHSYSIAINQPLANDSISESESESESESLISLSKGTLLKQKNTPMKHHDVIPPSIETVKLLCATSGLPDSEGEIFWNFYESKGWMVGKTKMRSLRGAIGGWAARWRQNQFQNSPEIKQIQMTDEQILKAARG